VLTGRGGSSVIRLTDLMSVTVADLEI